MTLEHSVEAKRLYNSKQWRKTRQAYMDSVNHLCERCGDAGYIVHHIEHIDSSNVDNPDVTLHWDNLELLCIDCHNAEHFRSHHATIDGLTFDEQGQLIQTKAAKMKSENS